MNYIPLKIKTNYSLLNSLIDIEKLVTVSKERNINILGICDDNMFGVMDFYTICKKNNIKPIIGLEVIVDDNKILLYCKNYNGYKNLCYISSNEKTIDLIKNNCSDLLCIIPYESINAYDTYKEYFNDIYVSYKSISERNNINNKKCIYLNDIRCLKKEDTKYLKYAYMIKNGEKIKESNEYDFSTNYFDLNVEIEKNDLINYKIINELCNVEIEKQNDLLPKYSSEIDFDEKKYLYSLCKKGLLKRFNNNVPIKYVKRLNYELGVINKMGFSNYFLVVWDFVKYAKKNDILVGPGRGSAAGSLVSYSLGITDVDPIKYNLFFERFLNPERVTMPDIDIDIESEKREEVIEYVRKKYGYDKVANIITFGTMKAKQVLRDVARLFDYDIDSFIKLFDSNLSLEENRKNNDINNRLLSDTFLSRIYDISIHLEGLKRHASINAAGVVISCKELDKYIPIYNQSMVNVTGYTIDHLENLGFLKIDFLALENLSLLSSLKNEIKTIDLSNIPLDDEKTFKIFKDANTDGIFQFESFGIKQVLRKFNVSSFEDIIALLALYRPGPMENIDLYINRKEGKEKIQYLHDDLKEILESTYGIIIYQEQIMQIATKFSSFTLGEADLLRRAMSKKKKQLMDTLKIKFISGAINNGYSKEVAIKIYDLIYKFANYGFNKSHSVCYALISYKLAYIKANYLPYFMCHLLSMVNGNENKIRNYILECKRNNIEILKPDINKSSNNFKIENNSIIYSLSSIKGIGNIITNSIIKERNENGNFTDFFNFVHRCKENINVKVLEILINAGAFDYLSYNHKTLINNIDSAMNYAELINDLDESLVEKPEIEVTEEYSKNELIEKEYEVFGFYLTNHPVQGKRKNNLNLNYIKSYFNKNIDLYLLIDGKREITTKKGDKMAFLTGSDEFNKVDIVIFPRTYEKCYMVKRGDIVFINGKVEKNNNEYQIIVNNLSILD